MTLLELKYTLKRNINVEAFLGINITTLPTGSVKFTQTQRVINLVKEYELENVAPPTVLMSSLFSDAIQDDSPTCDYYHAYMSLLGKLLLIIKTRPEISFAVNKMATRAIKAANEDFAVLLRIVAYLGGTRELGITLKKGSKRFLAELTKLICFVDAAHAHPDSKSHTRLCLTLPGLGGMFYCASRKGLKVSLESCEAEKDGAVEATKEIIFFRGLMGEIGFPQMEPTLVYAENSSMITLATDFSGNHKRVKHDITRINFLIQQVCESNYFYT